MSTSPPLSRRAVLAGLAAAAAAGRPARAAAATPARIFVLGDSMVAGGFGLFVARDLAKLHGYDVTRRGKSSTGLARPDFFDWIEEAERLVDGAPPDATVVMFGGNDVQGLYMGKRQWIRWHEPGWAEEYARRVRQLCRVVAPAGQRVFWVGMPVMRPPKFHERVKRVNAIFSTEMFVRDGGRFISTWDLLGDGEGNYAHRVDLTPADDSERTTRVRAGDGIHLSPAGAQYLADHVRAIVHAELSGDT